MVKLSQRLLLPTAGLLLAVVVAWGQSNGSCQNAYITSLTAASDIVAQCEAISQFSQCASQASSSLAPADQASLSAAVSAAVASRNCTGVRRIEAPRVQTVANELQLTTDPTKDVVLARGASTARLWALVETVASFSATGDMLSTTRASLAQLNSTLVAVASELQATRSQLQSTQADLSVARSSAAADLSTARAQVVDTQAALNSSRSAASADVSTLRAQLLVSVSAAVSSATFDNSVTRARLVDTQVDLNTTRSTAAADLLVTRGQIADTQGDLSSTRSTLAATQRNLSNYLTTGLAASLYVTAATATQFVTQSSAAAQFIPQASAAAFLTRADAASTYASLSMTTNFLNMSVANATFISRSEINTIFEFGSFNSPAPSCRAILTALPSKLGRDGLYYIFVGGVITQVYCDMTTDGGGWTLVNYAYRPVAGGTDVYFLGTATEGSWNPAARTGKAALSSVGLMTSATDLLLTVTNSGLAPVTGNALSYSAAYRWARPASYNQYNLASIVTSCVTVSVRELKSGTTFNAQTFTDRPQVSCSGHTGGTSFERQFIGFNSQLCYGVCGADPTTSMGMVVWYGSGYVPTTSGGLSDPARAASWGFWVR